MASNTITITLNGDNGDANYESSVVLVEDAARNATYEAGYDAECLSTEPSGILGVMLYGFVGTKKCEFIYSDDLHGIEFGFTSNVTETLYHLYITSNFSNSYLLYDNVEDEYIALDGSVTDYPFTATAGRVNVENRFSIYVPAAPVVTTVTTNDYGYASFSWNADLAVPAGLTVYKGVINGSYLDLEPMNYVKAGKGVIVKGAANTTYNFVAGSGDSDYEGNDLRPTSAFDPDDYSNVFVLQGNALYEYTGTTALKANKAYLQLPANVPAPARISFRFNGTTDVENVEFEAVKAEKFIENGQVLIRRGEAVYNLQGQMVK